MHYRILQSNIDSVRSSIRCATLTVSTLRRSLFVNATRSVKWKCLANMCRETQYFQTATMSVRKRKFTYVEYVTVLTLIRMEFENIAKGSIVCLSWKVLDHTRLRKKFNHFELRSPSRPRLNPGLGAGSILSASALR